jgi:hypothetical protein
MSTAKVAAAQLGSASPDKAETISRIVALIDEAGKKGVQFAVLFVRNSRYEAARFAPTRLLVGRGFGTMSLVNALFVMFAIGTSAILPLYARDRYGVSELRSGTLLTVRAFRIICLTGLA